MPASKEFLREVTAPIEGVKSAIRRRRVAFLFLVLATMALLVAAFVFCMLPGGFTVIDAVLTVLFALGLPWATIGLWNAIIGTLLQWRGNLDRTLFLPGLSEDSRLRGGRLALVMPIRDEDPVAAFRGLRASVASLDALTDAAGFEVFVLSDSHDDVIAAREVALFRAWQSQDPVPWRLHYRRRAVDTGFKAGNIESFCRRWGREFDLMIVLDAGSVMSGSAILRLAHLMQRNPRLGILQPLVVGLPTESPFARVFQFGARHGARASATGAAWWQADAGPYWGHNAAIRLAPFMEKCPLPRVPGKPPLGGTVLSHDQVEAALMRCSGHEVRVVPLEDGSYQANPPTLLEFIRRDLRVCVGKLQYLRLLRLPGLDRLARLQLGFSTLMSLSSPLWQLFLAIGLLGLMLSAAGVNVPVLFEEPSFLPPPSVTGPLGIALFGVVLAMTVAPKLAGLLQVLPLSRERRRYGGVHRLLPSVAVDLAFSVMLAPVRSVAHSTFIAGLVVRRKLRWSNPSRSAQRITVSRAWRRLWPQTFAGIAFATGLTWAAPKVLPWAAPVYVGLLLAVPFAVVTSSGRLGRALRLSRVCATPEELAPPPEVAAVTPWLSQNTTVVREVSIPSVAVASARGARKLNRVG